MAGIEMQLFGDGDAERPKQDPHHEAEVEVQKRSEEGRQMTRFEEAFVHRHLLSCSARPNPEGWGPADTGLKPRRLRRVTEQMSARPGVNEYPRPR